MNDKKQLFLNTIVHQRLGHAYLFVGAKGVGKAAFVEWLAQTIFCESPRTDGSACLSCDMCKRVSERNVIDFIEIKPDGQSIKVDQIRELKQQVSKRSAEQQQKICVIYQTETLTTGASNSLLKLLEEPDMDIHFFLLTEQVKQVLPTIQSRCQVVYFQESNKQEIKKQLLASGASEATASVLVYLTNSLSQATEWAQDEHFLEMKKQSWSLFLRLQQQYEHAFVTVQTDMMPLIQDKVAAQQWLDLLILYYRDVLQLMVGHTDALIQMDKLENYQQVQQSLTMERCLEAIHALHRAAQKIQANVGIQAAMEQWIIQCGHV